MQLTFLLKYISFSLSKFIKIVFKINLLFSMCSELQTIYNDRISLSIII